MVGTLSEQVVVALEAAGYAESTSGHYRKPRQYPVLSAQKQPRVYSFDFGVDFVSITKSARTGMLSAQCRSNDVRLVRLFDCYLRGADRAGGLLDESAPGVGMVRSPSMSPRYWPLGRRTWNNLAWR